MRHSREEPFRIANDVSSSTLAERLSILTLFVIYTYTSDEIVLYSNDIDCFYLWPLLYITHRFEPYLTILDMEKYVE